VPEPRAPADTVSKPGKLFVGGLSWETTAEALRAYFEKFGELTDCIVMNDSQTGRSRGFGFVTYADVEVASDMINKGPHTLDGRTIDPKLAVPRDQNAGGAAPQQRAGFLDL